MLLSYFLILLISFFILVKSGSLLVRTLFLISRFLGIGEFTLAFILMSFATSLPELFVGIESALSAKPTLSLGNILGANIINMTLALGFVTAISGGFALKSETAKRDIWSIWLISILPIILLTDLTLSRIDGIILLIVFFFYARHLLKEKVYAALNNVNQNAVTFKLFIKDVFLFIFGIILLFASSWAVVFSASQIASQLTLPLFVVGIFLLAFGTTLPETVFGLRSILTKHEDMALGNVLGSVAVNSTLILGIVSLIHPIQVQDAPSFLYASLFMIFAFLPLIFLIRTRERLTMSHGLLLMFFYVIFVIGEIIIKSAI
ncbi:MAG: K+-dependent Na+/Ca+ exchanger protein [Candidatus Azambacteria bacterium GW2011_GWB2_46_37]|uniref:K+-dependent Na+/Ca+ exchanger protein n=7 Tax=Candidatus Azamiibacteriota TaxID=1752741 RepID=A0A0G1Q6F6_9BACT|nr:MAG: K+-dependent Na+/Ca+ exchanger protein [Candidatus Azambacteria bacterium GW2011_GWA2_45_90]KKU22592.1 MAG: K+-dependent Na+/Ca+ exchanger protein [Candidatus Azambacteria bacterium GW2011_GWC1_46_13]KKU36545.1 MAG: K+-dependent Na+/Ca+ exchanger protein [Candidatus Azambacteria bacterium GW2011_GWB1_46_27]KKU37598.1 MAG: K+-dependent Na+/Ca+ exchanger protein [Candidatus Azambacteria bacterium GW2011_GWF2_46_32]KKU39398.1 MAG: K+-dependent Na+/Ca+ exchanger protein [Candidatus Azambact